jgi:hypothetical protein
MIWVVADKLLFDVTTLTKETSVLSFLQILEHLTHSSISCDYIAYRTTAQFCNSAFYE